MIPDAFALSKRYADLKMPVVIVAGREDRLIDIDKQSARLHEDVTHSTLHRVSGAGHMVHQTATDAVMAAVDEAAGARLEKSRISAKASGLNKRRCVRMRVGLARPLDGPEPTSNRDRANGLVSGVPALIAYGQISPGERGKLRSCGAADALGNRTDAS